MDTYSTAPKELCFIEFQAILDGEKNLIFKELAIAKKGGVQVWHFSTPQYFKPAYNCKSNYFLRSKYHGLDESFGQTPYSYVGDIIFESTCNSSFVLTKGLEKVKHLQKFISPAVKVVDLNVFGCSKYYNKSMACIFHSSKPHFECAQLNVYSNKQWFTDFVQFELDRFEYIRNNTPLNDQSNLLEKFEPYSDTELSSWVNNEYSRLYDLISKPDNNTYQLWSALGGLLNK